MRVLRLIFVLGRFLGRSLYHYSFYFIFILDTKKSDKPTAKPEKRDASTQTNNKQSFESKLIKEMISYLLKR